MNRNNKTYLMESMYNTMSLLLASMIFTMGFLGMIQETTRGLSVVTNYEILAENIHKQTDDTKMVASASISTKTAKVEHITIEPELKSIDDKSKIRTAGGMVSTPKDTTTETTATVPTYITPKIDKTNVTVLSGTNAETLNHILKDTWLAGYGEKFHELEQKHNVNALFAISNAFLETGWDKSGSLRATKHNNIFGLSNCKFKSIDSCIEFYFNLIDESYVGCGRLSMESINEKYCPPNPDWDNDIYSISQTLIKKI